MKPVRTVTAALLLAAGAAVFAAAPAYAVETPAPTAEAVAEQVCPDLDSGKKDVVGSKTSVEISAPDGFVITEYCVKAGSEQQGNGPVIVPVDPPVQTLTITYPGGKDISHYSFSYEQAPTTPPTTPPATTPPVTTPPAETTPPAGGGDGGAKLADTGFENGWLAFVGLGALAVGAAIAVPRMVAKRR